MSRYVSYDDERTPRSSGQGWPEERTPQVRRDHRAMASRSGGRAPRSARAPQGYDEPPYPPPVQVSHVAAPQDRLEPVPPVSAFRHQAALTTVPKRDAKRRRSGPSGLWVAVMAGGATVAVLGVGTLVVVAVLALTMWEPTPRATSSSSSTSPAVAVAVAPEPRAPLVFDDPIDQMIADLKAERAAAAARPKVSAPASPSADVYIEALTIYAADLWAWATQATSEGTADDGLVPASSPGTPRAVAPMPMPPPPAAAPEPVPEAAVAAATLEHDPLFNPAPAQERSVPAPMPVAMTPPPVAAPKPQPIPAGPIELSDDDAVDVQLEDEAAEVADLFIAPGTDEEAPIGEGLDDLEALQTVLVDIRLDKASNVPIEVDGKAMGTAPGMFQLAPGWHTIALHNRGSTSTFRLEANADPDEWCFESRGRQFRVSRCR
ncbi:MAG: hypothetical protein KTR31_31900 [Myxococcales bacterium]|nr:hypothetical protein [Myxococcales bacterium]